MSDDAVIKTPIVGTSYENRDIAAHACSVGDRLLLKHEPENQHDPNAIAVYTENDEQIGYLPRELSAKLITDFTEDDNLFDVTIFSKDLKEQADRLIPALEIELRYNVRGLEGLLLIDKGGRFYVTGMFSEKIRVKYESGEERVHGISHIIRLEREWSHAPIKSIRTLEIEIEAQNLESTGCPFVAYSHIKRFAEDRVGSDRMDSHQTRREIYKTRKQLPSKGKLLHFTYPLFTSKHESLENTIKKTLNRFQEGVNESQVKFLSGKRSNYFGISFIISVISCISIAIAFKVNYGAYEWGAVISGIPVVFIVIFLLGTVFLPNPQSPASSQIKMSFAKSNPSLVAEAKELLSCYDKAIAEYKDYTDSAKSAYEQWVTKWDRFSLNYRSLLKGYIASRALNPWDCKLLVYDETIDRRYSKVCAEPIREEDADMVRLRSTEVVNSIDSLKVLLR